MLILMLWFYYICKGSIHFLWLWAARESCEFTAHDSSLLLLGYRVEICDWHRLTDTLS
jgi:hypothetical protein